MKVGIVTITDNSNYGNRLQNYAMFYIMKRKLGYKTVSLVSYSDNPFRKRYFGNYLKTQVIRLLSSVCPRYARDRFGEETLRWNNFCKWNRNIPTKNYYGCKKLPTTLNRKFDYFVAGSDQIWNYQFAFEKFNDCFLKFAESKKKIAISASFGVENIPDKYKQIYIEGLMDFSSISVREKQGQFIIKNLINREVPVLIDPVMVLNKSEWLKLSRKPKIDLSKPYILKYYLGNSPENGKIDNWAENNGYRVYELLNKQIPELYEAGPGEFISLINNASLICSDSFHCIVFSIIFSKPFIVYSRQGYGSNMGSRLKTLLKKFGFEDRWETLVSEEEFLSCDYTKVPDILKKEKKKFMDYLINSLR